MLVRQGFAAAWLYSSTLGSWIHPDQFPYVAIRVFYTASVHEAEVLNGIGIGLAACWLCLRDESVDCFAAVSSDGQKNLAFATGIADGASSETGIVLVGEEHDADRVREHEG